MVVVVSGVVVGVVRLGCRWWVFVGVVLGGVWSLVGGGWSVVDGGLLVFCGGWLVVGVWVLGGGEKMS